MENMEVVGEDVKTSFVQTLEECASKCSQTDLCDSFWVFTAKVKTCHMKRNGEFNLNPRKSAGRCTKGLILKSLDDWGPTEQESNFSKLPKDDLFLYSFN